MKFDKFSLLYFGLTLGRTSKVKRPTLYNGAMEFPPPPLRFSFSEDTVEDI